MRVNNIEGHINNWMKVKKSKLVRVSIEEKIKNNIETQIYDKNLLSSILKSWDNIVKFRKLNKDNFNSFEDFYILINFISDYLYSKKVNKTKSIDSENNIKLLITIQHEILNYIIQKNLITNLDEFKLIHQNIQDCEYSLFNRKQSLKTWIKWINYYIINNFNNYFAQQELLSLTYWDLNTKRIKSVIKNVKNKTFELNCYFFYKTLLDMYDNYLVENTWIELLEQKTLVDENIFETLNSQWISDLWLKKIVMIDWIVSSIALDILIQRSRNSKKWWKSTILLQMLYDILNNSTNQKIIEPISSYILDEYPSELWLIAIIEKQNKYSHRAWLKALDKYPNSNKVLEAIMKNLPQLKELTVKKINWQSINKNNNHNELALRMAKLFMIWTQIPNLRRIIRPIAQSLTNPQLNDEPILSNMINIDKTLLWSLIGILNNKINNLNEYESFIKSIDNIIKNGNFSVIWKNSIKKNSVTIKEFITFRELLLEFKKSLLLNFIQTLEPNFKNLKKIYNLNSEYEDIIINWIIKNNYSLDVIEYISKNFSDWSKKIYFENISLNWINWKIKVDFDAFIALFNTKQITEKALFERVIKHNNINIDIYIFMINHFNEYYSLLAFEKILRWNISRKDKINSIHKINNGFKAYTLYNSIVYWWKNYNEYGSYTKYNWKLNDEESYNILSNGSIIDDIIIENLYFEDFSLKVLKKFIINIPSTSEIALNVYLSKKVDINEIKIFNNWLYDMIGLCENPILDKVIKYVISKNPTPLWLNLIIKNHPNHALKAARKWLSKFPNDEMLIKTIITYIPQLREECIKRVKSTSNNLEGLLYEINKYDSNISKEVMLKCDINKLLSITDNPKLWNIAYDCLIQLKVNNDIILEIIRKNNNFAENAFKILLSRENNSTQLIKIIEEKWEYSWNAFEHLFNKKSLNLIESVSIFSHISYFSSKYKNYNFQIEKEIQWIEYNESFENNFVINHLLRTKLNLTNIIGVMESRLISNFMKTTLIEWLNILQKNKILKFKLTYKQLTYISLATNIPAHILRSFIKLNDINPIDFSAYYKRRKNYNNWKIIDVETWKRLIAQFSNEKWLSNKTFEEIINQGKKAKIKIQYSWTKINESNTNTNIEDIEEKWNKIKNNNIQSFMFIKDIVENKKCENDLLEKIWIEFAESKPMLNSVTLIARLIISIPILKNYIKFFENKKLYIYVEDIEDEIISQESKEI